MKQVVLIGAGGHARVLRDALDLSGHEILGIVDPDATQAARFGLPWLGNDDAPLPAGALLVNAIGGSGKTAPRRAIFEHFQRRGHAFATVIHPTAIIAADVMIGEGSQVMAGAVIQAGARIGANCIVNTRAVVDHDCVIGDHCHLAPGSVLSGTVSIGACSHVGTGAAVIQGIRIGAHCLIGAGAAVTRDIPDGAAALGVPARIRNQSRG